MLFRSGYRTQNGVRDNGKGYLQDLSLELNSLGLKNVKISTRGCESNIPPTKEETGARMDFRQSIRNQIGNSEKDCSLDYRMIAWYKVHRIKGTIDKD